jgi:hypothetical protein
MAWLIAILLTIVALGNILDFFLGRRGQRQLKDRLVDWYILIAGAPWIGVIQFAAKTLDDFLSSLFGRDLISWLSLRRAIYISGALNILLVTAYLGYDHQFVKWIWRSGGKILRWNIFNIVVVLAINVLVDYVSLMYTRKLLRLTLQSANAFVLGGILVIEILATLVTVIFVISLSHATMLVFSAGAAIGLNAGFSEKLLMVGQIFVSFFFAFFQNHPWKVMQVHLSTGVVVLGFAVAFVPLLNFLILGLAWSAQASRRFTQRPLSLILERLEESPNGIFTTIAVALSALAGIIAAVAKAIS